MNIIQNIDASIAKNFSNNVPSVKAINHANTFYSNLVKIMKSFMIIGVKNIQFLELISEYLTRAILNQEVFIITLKEFLNFNQLDQNSALFTSIENIIVRNLFNNVLEEIDTLELAYSFRNHPKIDIKIEYLRKYSQIVLDFAFTMNSQELCSAFTQLIELSKTNAKLAEDYNKFLEK